jgi:ElaB/YqjD/DUF883 family membrane-anchored ribosome-binding protein
MTEQNGSPSGSIKATATAAKGRATEAAARAKTKATDAADRAKAKAGEAADKARIQAKKARDNAKTGVDSNPLAAIAGGIAVGAIIAGLLPRTATEDRAVGKVGTRIRTSARDAVNTAKENARTQLDELGLNADSAREKLGGLAGKVAKAATAVGTAAAEAATKKK